jgi:phosphonate metabolism-associated iron-containing alcohol dehydrogenase
MKPYGWNLPVAIKFGVGMADHAAQALHGRRVVVLAYAGATRHEHVARLSRTLCDSLIDWLEVPEGLSTMALGRTVASKVWPALARDRQSVLLGLGGGSVMDVAKWLRLRPEDGDPKGLDLLLASSAQPVGWTRHELWLLPTTAGTGSEVTRWSTLWDTDTMPASKRSFDQAYAYADQAVVDPLLSLTCPQPVVLHSALDAFGHCLEVLWNRHRNPTSVMLAVQAAQAIVRALPQALREPHDLGHRTNLSHAALQAGMAFSQTRTAIAHALSYPLTLDQGVAHGAAVAVWLPLAWRMAMGRSTDVDASLQGVWGLPPQAGLQRMHDWFKDIGFGLDLEQLGVTDVRERVQAALCHERGRNFEGDWVDGQG